MIFLYRLGIFFYSFFLSIAALFNEKASRFIQGRKHLLSQISKAKIAVHKPIWFHCSSLGEFEQARSLIDELHAKGEKILLTFFSPSGYEERKNYPAADWVFYLPLDKEKNAKQFLSLTSPKLAVFVKYDLWYFYLAHLKKRQVPTYLISALFHPSQIYFKSNRGKLHRNMLAMFDHIYLQNEESKTLLNKINIDKVDVVGDTRVDSVLMRAQATASLPLIEKFLDGKKAIVLGSVYDMELDLLEGCLLDFADDKIIIAPHEVDAKNINAIQKRLGKNSVRYSQISERTDRQNILIIDNIGTLFRVYTYAKLVFIGGGYSSGLHNTLEPAAFGVPICFGPKYDRFIEAVEMVKREGAFIIKSTNDLKELYLRLEKDSFREGVEQKIKDYMQESNGASSQILNDLLHQMQKEK